MDNARSVAEYRRQHNREKGECTWCGHRVPKGRRRWCGQECVAAWMASWGSWAHLCWLVEQRDRGVCAWCGCDTRRLRQLLHKWGYGDDYSRDALPLLRAAGWVPGRQLWEADHIVPRAEGGEDRLENLRTLCVPCHKARTAAWHGERARRRAVVRLRSRPHDHAGRIAGLLADMRQVRLSVIVEET